MNLDAIEPRVYARPGLDCFVSEFFHLGDIATIDALVLETGLSVRQVERYLARLNYEGRLEKLNDEGDVIPFRDTSSGDRGIYRLIGERDVAGECAP